MICSFSKSFTSDTLFEEIKHFFDYQILYCFGTCVYNREKGPYHPKLSLWWLEYVAIVTWLTCTFSEFFCDS